ncbi:MAG: hypothetical protein ACI978_002267 [Oleispira sp.]|jgi:hypothetical protein
MLRYFFKADSIQKGLITEESKDDNHSEHSR